MKPSLIVALAVGLLSASFAGAQMTKPAPSDTKTPPAAQTPKKPAVPKESAESRLAALKKQSETLTPEQSTKFVALLNQGDEKALKEIKGVGKARAKSIIASRPFAKVEDLVKVENLDSSTFPDLMTFAKGQQAAAPAKKPTPKTDPQ